MRQILALLLLGILALNCARAQNKYDTEIVAHRGYWDTNAQNSIASLSKAQEFGCWGSEFDLHLTADDVVVVNHDASIGHTAIQKSPFAAVRAHTLKNGEPVPTLAEYLAQGAGSPCVLVLELKPQYAPGREEVLVEKCLEAIREKELMNPSRVAFISFSFYICRLLAQKCPGFTVQYLEGDRTPAEVLEAGINGIDYHFSRFQRHPEWVKEAHDLGMSVNVWTVDSREVMLEMLELGVDQLTTNKPALARGLIGGKEE